MIVRKAVFDTNVYIGWLNHGQNEELMTAPGLVRYLSAVVQMELAVGAKMLPARRAIDLMARAYGRIGRVFAPGASQFDEAGRTLRKLRETGREIRRASLVADVLIAHSARSLGATVFTADADYEAIRSIVDFDLHMIDA